MPTVNCTQCGSEIQRRAYHIKLTSNPFCGFPCYAEWQKINRKGQGSQKGHLTCFVCNKPIARSPSAISSRNYCGRQCLLTDLKTGRYAGPNNPAWKGGHPSYRGENWNQQRQEARERDSDTCQHCGKKADHLPVHHLQPFCLFANYREANRLENLITLCPPCHSTADVRFWREHPELVERGHRPFPECSPLR